MNLKKIVIVIIALIFVYTFYPLIADFPKDTNKRSLDSKSKIKKKQQVNPPLSISSQLEKALNKMDIKSVRELLEKGADPNKKCPLCYVSGLKRGSRTEKIKMIDLLLEYGADINGNGSSNPLCSAAGSYETRSTKHFEDIMSYLLENGADINGDGKNVPLNCTIRAGAVMSASKNSAYFLLRKGALVDITDQYGDSPFDKVAKIKRGNKYVSSRSYRKGFHEMLRDYQRRQKKGKK